MMIKIRVKIRKIIIDNPTYYLWSNCTNLEINEILLYHKKLIEDSPLSAIKYLKDSTGLGLKECKTIQDEYMRLCYADNIDLGASTPSADYLNAWDRELKWRRKNDTS